VKFGMSMMGLSPRYYPEIALGAEANGFESVWMPEHLMLPASMPPTYPYSETGYAAIDGDTPMYDPWVVMATVAARTTTIRLATNVYVVPLRHPFVTARSVATLDRVSGGRVTLGAGVGWLEEEFVNAGQSFHDRGRRMDEIIPILRRLWSEDVIEHHGELYDFGPVKFQPKPLQKPNIPIHIGGHGGPALRRDEGAQGGGPGGRALRGVLRAWRQLRHGPPVREPRHRSGDRGASQRPGRPGQGPGPHAQRRLRRVDGAFRQQRDHQDLRAGPGNYSRFHAPVWLFVPGSPFSPPPRRGKQRQVVHSIGRSKVAAGSVFGQALVPLDGRALL
jgi:probable F420-dependent oxidoreductase